MPKRIKTTLSSAYKNAGRNYRDLKSAGRAMFKTADGRIQTPGAKVRELGFMLHSKEVGKKMMREGATAAEANKVLYKPRGYKLK